jgi:two-component system, LuxR family, response regulator FixJ
VGRQSGKEAQVNCRGLIQVSEAPSIAASNGAFATKPGLAPAVTITNQIDARGPVYIIDDDASVCDSLSVLLETFGFAVRAYASGAEFLNDDRRCEAKCLVIDQHMPGLDGLEVVRMLQRDGVVVPAILITGRLDPGIAQRAGELGIRAVLEKPFPVARLVDLVGSALAAPG